MKITGKTNVYSYGVVVMKVLTRKQQIDLTIPNGLHVVDWARQIKGGLEVLDPSLLSRSESEIVEMMQEIKNDREEFAKVDVLLKGSPTLGNPENKNSTGALATSSSKSAMQSLYPGSVNTSFLASSLL
ncbi:unnamed protein product [Fraxinus pennsylvanica]|uniref:Uncharacterized protein n=1 Tax=Fraxinus pennsylvanica TaxID=56036 RepID=A0AAD2E032_9LAMI|nr:unnamed protein product [Fraxinus pennsylvanica]